MTLMLTRHEALRPRAHLATRHGRSVAGHADGLRDARHVAHVETDAHLVRGGAHIVAHLAHNSHHAAANEPVAAGNVRRLGRHGRGEWRVVSVNSEQEKQHYRRLSTYTGDMGGVERRPDGRERPGPDRPVGSAEVGGHATTGHLRVARDDQIASA